MGFAAAAAPALTTAAPYIAAGTTTLGIIQAGKIGDYNEAVQNRKAAVLEQEAELIAKQTEFDLAQFDKQFRKLEGQTKVSIAKSGAVVGEGTGRRIEINNLREAEIEKNIIRYNSQIAQAKKFEEAAFARINANVAKEQAKFEQIRLGTQLGTSLLTMSQGFGSKPQSSTPQTFNLTYANYNPPR